MLQVIAKNGFIEFRATYICNTQAGEEDEWNDVVFINAVQMCGCDDLLFCFCFD